MNEDSHALDVVVELLGGEGVDGGGDFRQRAIGVFLGEGDLDVELDLTPGGRGVEQNLVRGDAVADFAAGGGCERIAGGDQPGIGLASNALIPLALLEMAELCQPL